jgi:hypothetical protein
MCGGSGLHRRGPAIASALRPRNVGTMHQEASSDAGRCDACSCAHARAPAPVRYAGRVVARESRSL